MHENVLNFKLDMAAGTEGAIRYIDIAKCMNLVNRGPLNKYRQNGLWTVLAARAYLQVNTVPVSACPFSVAIRGAPRSWVTRNAILKGFALWREQQKLAYDASSPSIKPKWQDFKVYLHDDHRTGTEIIPTSGDQFGADDPYIEGEWIHSKIVYTVEEPGAGTGILTHEPKLMIMGGDAVDPTDAVSLIRQYQISRAKPMSPDPTVPGAISESIYAQSAGSLGEQVIEITDNLESANDEPPYDLDNYPGGSTNASDPQSFAYASSPGGVGAIQTLPRVLNLNGFSAPNGLLQVQVTSQKAEGSAGEFWLQLVIGSREAY